MYDNFEDQIVECALRKKKDYLYHKNKFTN
jgi:hypothetical protein